MRRRRPARLRAAATLLVALAVLTALPAPASAATKDVSIQDFKFAPESLAASMGVKVRWTNNDQFTQHTGTSDVELPNGKPGLHVFGSGNMDYGDTFQRTLPWAATFTYFCAFHPYMAGRVSTHPTVRDASADEIVRYRVTWALADPKAGSRFDVQVRAPGGAFTNWYRGTARSKLIEPDEIGSWAFRARLVHLDGSRVTASTQYSPVVAVDVSLP